MTISVSAPWAVLILVSLVSLLFDNNSNLDLSALITSCVKWDWTTSTWTSSSSYDAHLKEELPPYYQPWMDIALRIPELVHARELRSHINEVMIVTSTVHYDCRAVAQNSYFWLDATAEQHVSAETQRVTAGPPGPQHDDDGLRLAGERERCSWGNYASKTFFFLPFWPFPPHFWLLPYKIWFWWLIFFPLLFFFLDATTKPGCSILGSVTALRASPNYHTCRCSIG